MYFHHIKKRKQKEDFLLRKPATQQEQSYEIEYHIKTNGKKEIREGLGLAR